MRFDAEQGHGANSGIHIALRLLEPIREQFSTISFADFHQLAGVVAVEVTGGPEIPFHPGREVSLCSRFVFSMDREKNVEMTNENVALY